MKRLLLLSALCLAFVMLQAQTQTFIYAKDGRQIPFEKNDTIQYVHFEPAGGGKGMGTILNNMTTLASRVDTISEVIYRCNLIYSNKLIFLPQITNETNYYDLNKH